MSDYSDSSNEDHWKNQHWLLMTPTAFLGRCGSHDDAVAARDQQQIVDDDNLNLVYNKLTLHLFFFLDNELVFFRKELSINSRETDPLCVPSEKVTTVKADTGKQVAELPQQDVPIRDLVLTMLQDEIRSGRLTTLQFMDFAHQDPVLLSKGVSRAQDEVNEYHDMDIAVMLSLDPAIKESLKLRRNMVLPRVTRLPAFYTAEYPPLERVVAEHSRSQQEMDPIFDGATLSSVYGRQSKCLKQNLLVERHGDKPGALSRLCERNLSAAIATWKTHTTQAATGSLYGYITFKRNKRVEGVFIIVMMQKSFEAFQEKKKRACEYDNKDGKGTFTYDIVGHIGNDDCAALTTEEQDDLEGMIGRDGRFKIRVMDGRRVE